MQPFGHNRLGPKIRGLRPFLGTGLGPHVTESRLGLWKNLFFQYYTKFTYINAVHDAAIVAVSMHACELARGTQSGTCAGIRHCVGNIIAD